ncbi:hypothetical protein BC830DRAFT_1159400, partial [Chytriomyces sp. MP71]
MGFNTQKQMHKNNPIQLKMVDNQIQLSEQVLRGSVNKIDNKVRDLERTLDEKKARDIETVQQDVENLKEDVSGLAGQINILKKEAAERKKTIDDEMNKIRVQAADQSAWNEDVYSKLYELQANSSLLMAEYEEKQKQLREKQYIDSDANTSAFYSKIFSKMNEVFVASKAIQSGMVDRSKYSNGDKAVGYITLVGSLIPLPAAATILGYVAQGVQYLSDKRESERINNITSNALGFSEMDEICDWISRGLCFAYEEQIRALKASAAETFAECCVAYILEFLAKKDEDRRVPIDPSVDTTIVHVATDADGNPLGEAGSGVIPSVAHAAASALSPQEQLVSDLLVYMSKRRGVRNGSYMMSNVKLEARIPGIEWTDWGIIKQTGLRTPSGTIYHAVPVKPAVKKQGWNSKEIEHRKPGPSASPAPRASESSLASYAPAAEPSPPTPSPPVMKKSPSFGAKLFRWKEPKEVAKAAQEALKSVADVKEKAADVA